MENKYVNKAVNFSISVVAYSIIIFLTDILFDTLYAENIIYVILAALTIMILEKTLKPILFRATISITALTFGLFYPVINLIILKIVDFVLGPKFDVFGIFWGLVIAILISFTNLVLNKFVLEPIIRKDERNE